MDIGNWTITFKNLHLSKCREFCTFSTCPNLIYLLPALNVTYLLFLKLHIFYDTPPLASYLLLKELYRISPTNALCQNIDLKGLLVVKGRTTSFTPGSTQVYKPT